MYIENSLSDNLNELNLSDLTLYLDRIERSLEWIKWEESDVISWLVEETRFLLTSRAIGGRSPKDSDRFKELKWESDKYHTCSQVSKQAICFSKIIISLFSDSGIDITNPVK